ncbi:vacuolar protein-sorting-associated protein 33 homolog [Selaginella moellendorffii]|uniref:vacuolar protein-sorting-associated protein 33 homolog n=1 Tax=Selaginella moellendorffii TaxID=88036 RepID=UPI000D1CF669|nr:vacuolar protein-sorting-associated protein 33 homolog [Selaginella moellendorffii]|eukprot:XP_024521213.1 vacuolar protein-sorting-associated protein 33 homolog [Selaginella moellendorffii]
MAQLPPLENAPINLIGLRKEAQLDLVEALDSMRGRKLLVLDPKLSGPLTLIVQISLLKEHGVENLSHLSGDPIQSDCTNVIYIVRPHLTLMKLIAAQIQHDKRNQQERQYSLYFMPRRSTACEKVLEAEGVHGGITFGEYRMFPIPFDDDVLSLEHELVLKELQVDGDPTSLWDLALTINNLQSRFGLIPNVKGKGDAAKKVFSIMKKMQEEQALTTPEGQPEIDTLILLDRQVDLVTPMCSQLTYEGLVDEFLNINNGCVELDPAILGGDKKVKVPLNSSDKLYRDLRDLNFGVVGGILREKAASMKQDYTDVKTTNQEFSDLKKFVKKMHALPEMTRHIDISQYLTTFTRKRSFMSRLIMEQTLVEGQEYDICYEYIEEMINKQEPLISVLRLLVILSVTNNGLQKKHFDYFRRELLQSYGWENLFFINDLERAGLLRKQESKSNWLTLKRGLRLVVSDTDDSNPKDISYAFSGYAPLSIRLVQHALHASGWRGIEDMMKLLPGATFEERQGSQQQRRSSFSHRPPSLTNLTTGHQRMPSANNLTDLANNVDGRRALVLVVFIGGVTFAEISALRFLSAQESMKHDVIVLTTKLCNGTSFLQSLQTNPLGG